MCVKSRKEDNYEKEKINRNAYRRCNGIVTGSLRKHKQSGEQGGSKYFHRRFRVERSGEYGE